MNSPTALITGGSSGIGLALAKVFAKNNYNIIITARKQEELDKAASNLRGQFKVDVKTIVNDLSKAGGPQEIFDFCVQNQVEVEVLANNAGIATYGKFAETDLKELLTTVDLNVRAVTELTRLFLPGMLERKRGKILNVSSTAAFQPGPLWAVYGASKAYIFSFSLAIRNEVKNTGIFVTAICPGAVKTNFQNATKGFNQTRLIKSGTKARFMLQPDEVAEAAYKALMKNKAFVVIGFVNKFLAFWARILPRSWVTAISRWTLEK